MSLYRSKRIIWVLLLLSVFGCKQNSNILQARFFTLEAPKEWKLIEEQGIDSYVGRIVIGQQDTLSFDLGWYSSDLSDESSIPDSAIVNIKDPKVSWLIIDGRKAKVVLPTEENIGLTGIYIDSLWQSGSNVDRFQMSGVNLRKENSDAFIEVIKTLKFYKEGV